MFSDDSASDGDSYSNSDDEEKEVYEQKVADGIRDGHVVVKNGDGTYRCPLSPARKKQSYKYRELLTHATQIGSGKKGPEKVGGHRALEKFLLAELDGKPMVAQAERVLHLEQAVPSRGTGATHLLAPWMGILVNIDNTRTNEEGLRLAAGGADIKEKFQECKPENVEVFHDYHGHQGTAVLTFRNDIDGLEDAQAFEHDFATANRGSKEWWDEKRADNLDLYGWQAAEEDLTANLGQMTAFLKKFCALKSVRDMVGLVYRKVSENSGKKSLWLGLKQAITECCFCGKKYCILYERAKLQLIRSLKNNSRLTLKLLGFVPITVLDGPNPNPPKPA